MNLETSDYKKGDFVKVSKNGERFWCEITGFDQERNLVKTRIDNQISNTCIVGEEKKGYAEIHDTLWITFDDIIGKWES